MSKASYSSQSSLSPDTGAELRAHHIRRSVIPLVAQLGTLQDVYEVPMPALWLRALGPLCILFGLLILGVFWREYTLLFSWWPRVQVYILLAVSAIWLLVGLVLTAMLNFSSRSRILVCTRGLISIQRKTLVVEWRDIQQFWKHIRIQDRTKVKRTYTIRTVDGKTLVFDHDIPDVARLGHGIERRVTRFLLPQLLDAYYAGQRISFERIALHQDGVSITRERLQQEKQARRGKNRRHKTEGQQEILPWHDIQHISVDDTSLSIYKKGQYWDWFTLPINAIPNANVLKGMVDTIEYEQHDGPLQRNLTLYSANIPVVFGDIRISTRGVDIEHGKIVLSWSELGGIGVGEQEVILKRKGRFEEWYALPLWRVENPEHLKDLVEHIMEIR